MGNFIKLYHVLQIYPFSPSEKALTIHNFTRLVRKYVTLHNVIDHTQPKLFAKQLAP